MGEYGGDSAVTMSLLAIGPLYVIGRYGWKAVAQNDQAVIGDDILTARQNESLILERSLVVGEVQGIPSR